MTKLTAYYIKSNKSLQDGLNFIKIIDHERLIASSTFQYYNNDMLHLL